MCIDPLFVPLGLPWSLRGSTADFSCCALCGDDGGQNVHVLVPKQKRGSGSLCRPLDTQTPAPITQTDLTAQARTVKGSPTPSLHAERNSVPTPYLMPSRAQTSTGVNFAASQRARDKRGSNGRSRGAIGHDDYRKHERGRLGPAVVVGIKKRGDRLFVVTES